MTAMNRNDWNTACSIIQSISSSWFKAVHVISRVNQELRTLPVAHEFLFDKQRVHENEFQVLLRPFGLNVGHVVVSGFEARARELIQDRARLELCKEALLAGRAIPGGTIVQPSL